MSARLRPDPEAIESPCNNVCVIDEESGYCEDCRRTLDEIAEWSSFSPAERRRIIAELDQRNEGRDG
jgi:uncharacterized protein